MLEMGPQDPVPSDSSKYPLSQSEPCASQRDDSHLFSDPQAPSSKGYLFTSPELRFALTHACLSSR